MKFLVDECLSPSFVDKLGNRGYPDAVHPMHIGLFSARDDTVLAHAIADDRILITANARDFRRLVARAAIHPGVIIVEPRTRDETWQLILLAIAFIEQQPVPADYMVNKVVEVSATAGITSFELPEQKP